MDLLLFIASSLGSFIGALAAVKTDITWIKRMLFTHDKRISNIELKGVSHGKNQSTF